MKHSASLLIVSMVVAGLLFAGCSQSQQETQDEPVSVKAAIITDCIVHYYKTNASAYITRQKHGYNPSTGFFQAVSIEPTGTIQCSLLKDDYHSADHRQGCENEHSLGRRCHQIQDSYARNDRPGTRNGQQVIVFSLLCPHHTGMV